uniref:Uncharacterized protein n=1 Tax=Brassica oleracea var. oleracea TaxID=109376 RepID=A0A0D3EBS2_BRAOL
MDRSSEPTVQAATPHVPLLHGFCKLAFVAFLDGSSSSDFASFAISGDVKLQTIMKVAQPSPATRTPQKASTMATSDSPVHETRPAQPHIRRSR